VFPASRFSPGACASFASSVAPSSSLTRGISPQASVRKLNAKLPRDSGSRAPCGVEALS
jgi:hypothetical protein